MRGTQQEHTSQEARGECEEREKHVVMRGMHSYERNARGAQAREEQKRITMGARTREECEKSTSTGGAREPRSVRAAREERERLSCS